MSEMTVHEHDIVELTRAVDGWPAGTIGAIVSLHPHSVLVEIEDPEQERELLEGLVTVPHGAFKVVETRVSASR